MIEFSTLSERMVDKETAVVLEFMCYHNNKKGWRFPTDKEYIENVNIPSGVWSKELVERNDKKSRFCFFVRDIDDENMASNSR